MSKIKLNFKNLFFVIIIYFLIFQNLLQTIVPIFKYLDELLAMGALFFVPMFIIKRKKIKKNDAYLIIILALLNIVGFISNDKSKLQPFKVILTDCLLINKFFLAYLLFGCLNEKNDLIEKDKLKRHVKLIIIILLFLTILNEVFKIFPYTMRYGLISNQLFYSHPSILAAMMNVLLILYLYLTDLKTNFAKDGIYVIACILVIASTLRAKALAFCVVFLVLMYYIKTKDKKISFSKLGILGIIAFIVGFNQIEFYFVTLKDSARASLLRIAIRISKEFFPIGTGFATFGSYMAAANYSPLYYKYGLNEVYGLEKGGNFLSDSFWPMILGQFGVLGCILYVLLIVCIFRKIQNAYRKNEKNKYLAKLGILLYLLIASTSESAFVNSYAIPLAVLLGM